MKLALEWLAIWAVLALSSQVCARGDTEVPPETLPDGSIAKTIYKFKPQCPHRIHRIASPQQITGTWYLQEIIAHYNFTGNAPCVVSTFSTDDKQLIAKSRIQGETNEEHIRKDILQQADDGMWEYRATPTPGGILLGFSPKGMLVWCSTSDPLHRPIEVASMLFARQPVADFKEEESNKDSRIPRWRAACLPSP